MPQVYHFVQLTLFPSNEPLIEHVNQDCTCGGKKCIGCKVVKCYGHFGLQKKDRGVILVNLNSYCRPCNSKRGGEPIRLRRIENAKRWNKAHPEQTRKYHSNWIKRHPGRYDSIHHRNMYVRYRQNNPESYRARNKTMKANRRARIKQAEGTFTSKEWLSLKTQYNHTCLRCGKSEPEIKITPDHVIPLAKGGSNTIGNIQPLCLPCNKWKRVKTIDFRPENT